MSTARQQLHPPGRSPDHREHDIYMYRESAKKEFCVSGEVGIEILISLIEARKEEDPALSSEELQEALETR